MLKKAIDIICGDPKLTPFRVRFLNGVCAMVIIFGFAFGAPMIAISGIGNIAFFVLFLSMAVIALSYYFSRFTEFNAMGLICFQIGALLALDTQWFQTSGIFGSVPYYYIIGIGVIISVSKQPIISIFIFLANLTALIILEYQHPEWVKHYQRPEDAFIASVAALVACCIFMSIILMTLKRATEKVGDTTIDAYEKLQQENEILNYHCEKLEIQLKETKEKNQNAN